MAPHTRLPEASPFLQDNQGAEIARRITSSTTMCPVGLGARRIAVVDAADTRDLWRDTTSSGPVNNASKESRFLVGRSHAAISYAG